MILAGERLCQQAKDRIVGFPMLRRDGRADDEQMGAVTNRKDYLVG